MRVQAILIAGVLTAGAALAESGASLAASDASQRLAATVGGPQSRISMWIWSDKYVYQPGQSLTLKWTVKTNGDLYPYSVLAYRVNNQTGNRVYLPGGADAPTDIYGNSVSQGFAPTPLTDVTKGVLIGANGRFPAMTIPTEPGMHTVAVELRDYTGTKVVKTAYMKIGVVTKVETLSGEVTSDRTLTNDTQWNLAGAVFVKNNATLTIQPGTFIIGQPGSQPPSVLVVTRNGKLMAAGTKARPIVMTSSQAFGQRARGDWGGLIMLGKAPINVGASSGGNNNPAGSFYIEGLNATEDGLYGGDDPNHSCGTVTYVRVEYAGSILSPNNETNSFTWGGCGKGTVAHHLQAIYAADDSFEWFGGTMDARYLVGGLGADDYVDFQLGYVGSVQYGLFYQSAASKGNRGIEGDNSEYNQAATPYSNPSLYNLTFIGSGQPGFDEANSPGIFLRRGARGSINNTLVTNFYSGAVDISDANTQAQADASELKMNGIMMWGNNKANSGAATLEGQITSAYTLAYAKGEKGVLNGVPAGRNFIVMDPMLRTFEPSDPDFMGMPGSPLTRAGAVAGSDNGFLDQSATFIGGMGSEDWTREWTSFLIESDIQ